MHHTGPRYQQKTVELGKIAEEHGRYENIEEA